jgi:hypothetical protein
MSVVYGDDGKSPCQCISDKIHRSSAVLRTALLKEGCSGVITNRVLWGVVSRVQWGML